MVYSSYVELVYETQGSHCIMIITNCMVIGLVQTSAAPADVGGVACMVLRADGPDSIRMWLGSEQM